MSLTKGTLYKTGEISIQVYWEVAENEKSEFDGEKYLWMILILLNR